MKEADLKALVGSEVVLWLDTGEVLTGRLIDRSDDEPGVYHVEPVPDPPNMIVGEGLVDVRPERVTRVERLSLGR